MEENRIFQEQPTQLATIDGKTPLDKEGIRTACSAILELVPRTEQTIKQSHITHAP